MGENKALLSFRGEKLIERMIRRVSFLSNDLLVSTNQPEDFDFLNVRLAGDLIPGKGSLSGVYTALYEAREPYVAVLACDMPFINPDLIRAEFDFARQNNLDVVIPRTPSGLEPLHAIYRRENCLEAVLTSLQENHYRVISWFPKVKTGEFGPEKIKKYDPEYFSFFNINTPQDKARAEEIADLIDG